MKRNVTYEVDQPGITDISQSNVHLGNSDLWLDWGMCQYLLDLKSVDSILFFLICRYRYEYILPKKRRSDTFSDTDTVSGHSYT